MAESNHCPGLVPKAEAITDVQTDVGPYGVPENIRRGFSRVKDSLAPAHPLEYSEKHYLQNREKLDLAMLRNIQGLHAPMKLQMERVAVCKIQRLPCLQSSRVALDTLLGTDEYVGFEDVLNAPMDAEITGMPHTVMEARLGIN